jgi:hypothetical protein
MMSSLGEHPPKNGGRVTLKLLALGDDSVRYQFTLLTSHAQSEGTLQVSIARGEVSFEQGLPPEAAAWMRDLAHALVRGAWRNRAEYGWPRRITRWRPEPRLRGK